MRSSGDLVTKEGKSIVVTGRRDHQIKRSGYRIQLESVQHVLNSKQNVSDS
jgi:acyl-coenzyme A synthetase/AMP-(fatty) acid ligase